LQKRIRGENKTKKRKNKSQPPNYGESRKELNL